MPDDLLFDTMPNGTEYPAKPSLAYAKLVATPTNTSWSQVYNAGNLFACLSLAIKDPEDTDNPASLHALGKDVFSILESEFFTLEDKNLTSVKDVITMSITHVPSSVSISLSLALFKDSALYLFILGGGKIQIKRGEQIGVLLQGARHDRKIITASGFVNHNDTILLQTEQFAQDISDQDIASALELSLPNDIAEVLSPHIHKKDDGGQAAIVVSYRGVGREREETPQPMTHKEQEKPAPASAEEESEEDLSSLAEAEEEKPAMPKLPHLSLPHIKLFHLSHKKRLFLSIAIILIAILGTSIMFTRDKENKEKQHELFVSVYEPAKKSYEEGEALESLNTKLSREEYLKAQTLLKDNQSKFEPDSSEAKQINELLAKVESALGGETQAKATTPAKAAAAGASPLLNLQRNTPSALTIGNDGTVAYFVTEEAVTRVNLSSQGQKTELIKNDKAWEKPQAITPYQGNIYILDQENGVLKYVPSGTGFEKSSYFKKSPDLSKATGMAIDGSIWILFSDGTIMKYTKGESDGFKVKGLDKEMSNATKIFTTVDTDFIYVLDKGNGRVIKLTKEGDFQSQHAHSILTQADNFDISEEDKKIYILANKKVWEIPL